MAKIKRTDRSITRDVDQPTRRLNIFQRGVRGIMRFIRPARPAPEIAVPDPEETEGTTADPAGGDDTTTPDTGGATTGTGTATDPGNDPTNPVNTDDMEPFIGEIKMFAGNFAPRGWAFCDGQTLDISSYQALYSIIGTTYGGDGRTNFNLPDMRGRVSIHPGQGPGLSQYHAGSSGGDEMVTLNVNQLPDHTHSVKSSTDPATSLDPAGNLLSAGDHNHYSQGNPDSSMSYQMISPSGGGQPHSNMQPYLAVNYIIALEGIYPSRS